MTGLSMQPAGAGAHMRWPAHVDASLLQHSRSDVRKRVEMGKMSFPGAGPAPAGVRSLKYRLPTHPSKYPCNRPTGS